jgi:hypothetical protein
LPREAADTASTCVQGWGFFDGPVDEASILAVIARRD